MYNNSLKLDFFLLRATRAHIEYILESFAFIKTQYTDLI